MMRRRDDLSSLRHSEDSRPLLTLLPYVMCGRIGDFEPLHLLDDGSVGFALEFDTPAVDTKIGGEEAISGLIDQALRALPDDVQWQWFVQSSPFVEGHLKAYGAQSGDNLVAQTCTMHYVRRWREAQREGFFPQDATFNFFPRSQSILVALKSASLIPASSPLSAIFRRSRQWSGSAVVGFIEASRSLWSVLESQGILASPVGADRLANWVIDLLFPWRRFEHPPVRTGLHSVREAIASLGRIDLVQPCGFRTVSAGAEAHHRVASMLWHPRAVRPGMLNSLVLLRPCMSVCLSGRALPLTSSSLQLKAQGLLNARSANRFNEVETQARAQALTDVEQRLISDGERLVEGRLQVHLIEPTAEEAEDAGRTVCSHLRELDIESAVEEDIGSSLILRGCLPFALYDTTERKLRRRRRFLSRDFADIHPAGGCWQGMPSSPARHETTSAPVVMYSNPVGGAMFLDPSKAERNPHALVVGQSGSGKSFFVHDYLLHLWRLPDVRLYLISIKPDYRKLAMLLGRYVELTLDSAESLNPFVGAPTLENQARWVAALSLMITEGRADRHLSREQQIALQESALAASARNWDAEHDRAIRETILEDICLELERRAGALGRDLAFQLHPYRRGPFRRLFNGERALRVEDRFVFFNLGNILRQSCSAAVSFCVFNLIDQVMQDPTLRVAPKGLIADEVWALVQDPFAAAILERSLKAYRSLGGFALPIVQDPCDLDTPAGRVILVNTATKVILPMDRSGQDEISRFVRLNERELDLVRNLRLVKRRYSEFFVSIEGIHSAKGLLIPDPLRYAISTTDPADEAELDRLYRETGDMLKTVQRFALEMPYGVRAVEKAARFCQGRVRWALLVSLLTLAIVAAAVFAWPRPGPRILPAFTPREQIAERERAAEQAARLLTTISDPVDAEAARSHALSDRENETLKNGASPQIADRPTGTIDELQALARSWSNASQHLHGDSVAPKETAAAPLVALRRMVAASKSPIPDKIENASTAQDNDSLQDMSVQVNLVTLASAAFPWVLLEVRSDQPLPQARLAKRGVAEGGGAWFEPGDSVASGWMLTGIGSDSATVMSSGGSLVQLSLVAASNEAATHGKTEDK